MGEIIIATLATFGLSTLMTSYDGPRDVFLHFRIKYPKSPLHCTVCTSMWVAIIFFITLLLGFAFYLMPLAIVGIVILLEKI